MVSVILVKCDYLGFDFTTVIMEGNLNNSECKAKYATSGNMEEI